MNANKIWSNQVSSVLGAVITSGMTALASTLRGKASGGNAGRRPKGSNDFPRQFSWATSLYAEI